MTDARPLPVPPSLRSFLGLPLVIWSVALTIVLPELVLSGTEYGLWGAASWRSITLQYGGFWVGLLKGWQPNYPAQPALMFATYALLHAGNTHLGGNLLALLFLGPQAAAQLGTRGFLLLYAASALGGAAVFGLVATSAAPMVGASGAIFGLAGAATLWDWQRRRSGFRTAGIMAGLVAFNLVTLVSTGGLLAWQTHLGGFVAGWLVALWLGRRV